MDIQGLVYLLNLAGNALSQANERIEQLTREVEGLRAKEDAPSAAQQ